MNTAIILAAGLSNRFNSSTPKQFLKLNGKMLIEYSVEKFLKNKNIEEIIIVTQKKYIHSIKNIFNTCKVIEGGKTRQESSLLGLKACSTLTKNVLIHDAARPFVSDEIINKCIDELKNNLCVCPALPCTDTIAKIQSNYISQVLDRSILYKLQTPQSFDYQVLYDCHKKVKENFTDDMSIVQKYGHKCKIIEGSKKNIKVTYEKDIKYLDLLI